MGFSACYTIRTLDKMRWCKCMDGLVLSILRFVAKPLVWAWQKISQPKIPYPKAPRNILRHTLPGVSQRQVEQHFGAPFSEELFSDGRTVAGYVFSNALVQIDYDSTSNVQSCLLVSLYGKSNYRWPLNKFRCFEIPYIGLSIGSAKINSIFSEDYTDLAIEYSSKFLILWQKNYFGNQGRYNTYSFAFFEADTEPSANFCMPDYEIIDGGIQGLARLTKPEKHAFNAIRISKEEYEKVEHFGYCHGVFP